MSAFDRWRTPVLPTAALLLLVPALAGIPRATGSLGRDDVFRDTSDSPGVIVLTGGHVLPMDRDTLLRDHAIVIRDGRIEAVGAEATLEIPAPARRIDLGGAYVVPGLVDVHAHAGEEALPLYVAAGVTTVRMMHGFPQRIENRRRQEEGDVPWPNLLSAGPLIAGEEVPWPHVLVDSPEEARRVAGLQARAGYDFLKVYDGLSRPAYEALVAEAGELGIPFDGHVPAEVGVPGVLGAGQRTVEHTEQLLYATFGRTGVMKLPVARIDTVVGFFRDAGVGTCVTPTLRAMTLIMRRGTGFTDSVFAGLDWELVDPEVRGWWESYRAPAPEAARSRREHFLELQQVLTRELHAAGVPILAGTDTPYPLLVPGASAVDEVEALAAAGLTPYQALAAATRVAGQCLVGSGERFGVVRAGARADLLVLASDPRANLRSLDDPRGVMVRGRWYPGDTLGALRQGVREAYGG